ncbi:energy transducer TonB [Mucilaginibacter terrae]|uniref:TonB C-terminal domain-containing protein n=1 Tax=Mucilaginibacter terrae TaxID=1955052 RepID=A0ABU3H062_9SPHI|nr:energy transducer TonB [Mucilaginibacter terrae]MDT3404632.1 hypothetical protein [Mucilaginibacter terrae]
MAENQITNVKLSFTCSENWDAMAPTPNGRHCNKCNKTIHDFTNSKVEEFRAVMAENDYSICGHFTQNQISSMKAPFWKKWVSVGLVLIGFNFFFKKAEAQTIKIKDHNKAKPEDIPINGMVLEPQTMPSFPGGFDRFHQFILKTLNTDRIAGIKGREIISFMVEKNGELSSFKVLRSIGSKADKEIIRVLKLSPKWTPAKLNGKSVRAAYTIPIVIN